MERRRFGRGRDRSGEDEDAGNLHYDPSFSTILFNTGQGPDVSSLIPAEFRP
jgi:hypothetical protein